jgi:subtilisin family serine protease
MARASPVPSLQITGQPPDLSKEDPVGSRRITGSMFLLAALAMVAPFSVAAGAPELVGNAAATPSGIVATPQAADRSARATIAIGDAQNQVIVHFRDRAAFRSDTAHRTFGQVVDENPDLNSRLLRVPDVLGAITGLDHNPNVLFAERNPVGEPAFDPNDPLYYSSQWHLGTWATTHGSNLRGAWDLTAGYKGAKIVIVDTGLDYTHPDFAGKNPTGYNFAENSTNWYDCFGHGTEVTGTAAATTNNGVGVAGVDMWTGIYVAKIYAHWQRERLDGRQGDLGDLSVGRHKGDQHLLALVDLFGGARRRGTDRAEPERRCGRCGWQ